MRSMGKMWHEKDVTRLTPSNDIVTPVCLSEVTQAENEAVRQRKRKKREQLLRDKMVCSCRRVVFLSVVC